jgi:hypothetical protein
MQKVKVKSKTIGNKEDNAKLGEIFNTMMGTENLPLDIIIPKYEEMITELTKIHSAYSNILNRKTFELGMNADIRTSRDKFLNELKYILSYVDTSKLVFSKEQLNYEIETPEEVKTDISTKYKEFTKHSIVTQILVVLKNLANYKDSIRSAKKLDGDFLVSMYDFKPFEFCPINISYLYTNGSEQTQKDILLSLSIIYKASSSFYKVYNKPDIDVSQFSEIIMGYMTELKKRIPRCNKAFDRIEQSVGMLNNNFKKYYKEFSITGDKSIMITSFISDVSKNTKVDADLARQFRDIIKFYKKMSANSPAAKDDRLKFMFDSVDKHLDNLDELMQGE